MYPFEFLHKKWMLKNRKKLKQLKQINTKTEKIVAVCVS